MSEKNPSLIATVLPILTKYTLIAGSVCHAPGSGWYPETCTCTTCTHPVRVVRDYPHVNREYRCTAGVTPVCDASIMRNGGLMKIMDYELIRGMIVTRILRPEDTELNLFREIRVPPTVRGWQ
jgi:hypothetical protein